jgi:hypothetical protein
VHRHNLAVSLAVGDRIDLGRIYVDLRAQEIVGVYTWLSAAHTTPGWGTLADPWLPKVPLLGVDVGMELR